MDAPCVVYFCIMESYGNRNSLAEADSSDWDRGS